MVETCPFGRPTAAEVCSPEGLLYFVWEREAIRLARENGHPAPWSDDPVFRKYKFTNVRRRDDRVSRWIIDKIINRHDNRADLWFSLLIARLVNWPPTLQLLLHSGVIPAHPVEFNAAAFSNVIESYKETGAKIYSGAYMVYPTKKDVGGNKSSALARHIIAPVASLADELADAVVVKRSIAEFVKVLSGSFGISTFMAGQVAADLTYSKRQLGRAVDLYTYAPIGPGSSRGLNYLLGRKPFAGWTQSEFNDQLVEIRTQIQQYLAIDDITLHDVQNVMCEFSKYCRVVLGEGVPKTTYKPETEF